MIYEGAPNYPSLDRWWQIIETYGVTTFYTSPTAIRMFMQHGDHPWHRCLRAYVNEELEHPCHATA